MWYAISSVSRGGGGTQNGTLRPGGAARRVRLTWLDVSLAEEHDGRWHPHQASEVGTGGRCRGRRGESGRTVRKVSTLSRSSVRASCTAAAASSTTERKSKRLALDMRSFLAFNLTSLFKSFRTTCCTRSTIEVTYVTWHLGTVGCSR